MKRNKTDNFKRPILRSAFIIIGCVLILDTLIVRTRSSLTLGIIMPAILGAPLLMIGLFMPAFVKASRKRRWFKAFMWLLSFGYLLFALTFIGTTAAILINGAEPAGEADAVIVLGGGIRGNSPTLLLKYRLDKTLEYLNEHGDAVCVVSGGQGPDETVSEASVMKNYLVGHGIAEERILLEDRSESTEENFIFSKAMIDETIGDDADIVFVTTKFHVFRAERTAKRLGLEAQGIPAKGVWWLSPNDYLRESVAIVLYFITGKI